jgi:hypothetical protein
MHIMHIMQNIARIQDQEISPEIPNLGFDVGVGLIGVLERASDLPTLFSPPSKSTTGL